MEVAQNECCLFRLPAEIRTKIFRFALTAYNDHSRPYRADRKYYRPGYHYHARIDTSLLRTCKRVYRETRPLPVFLNEHVFWLFNGPWKSIGRINRNTAKWMLWYHSLTQEQRGLVHSVHIFAQQYFLEMLGTIDDVPQFSFRTVRLHLTIRHADWWSWESPAESNDRLGICPWRMHRTSCLEMLAEPATPSLSYIKERMGPRTWGGQICQIQGLKMLELEFEIGEEKRSQLQAVIERAKYWKFPLTRDPGVLRWTGDLNESSWEGLRDLKDDHQFLVERLASPQEQELPKRKYYVVSMYWEYTVPPATDVQG